MRDVRDWRQVEGQYGQGFLELLEAGRQFWRVRGINPHHNTTESSDSGNYVIVELLTQDIRVNLRNLTLAAALSLETGARIIAVVGCEPTWRRVVWGGYEPQKLQLLAQAWGATQVLDLEAFVASGDDAGGLVVDHRECTAPKKPLLKRKRLEEILDSTYARVLRVPTIGPEHRVSADAQAIQQFSRSAQHFWEALFTTLKPLAFVTSHVDYAQWCVPVTVASTLGIPSLHVQSTGGLKAYYGLSPSWRRRHSFRRTLTRSLGRYFEREIWAHRDALAQPAEVVTWRARQNLGVPAWWRRDGEHDRVLLSSQAERQTVREWACSHWGLDPKKPSVAVFNHAVSDALDGNHEAFASLHEWFAKTAAFAAKHPEVNWLFLDHPRQNYYDTTDSFARLAREFGHHQHLHFMPSSDLSKNELWALTDLVVTTRGSVSNEFPAFGVPALQAGWSEWSHCGFTLRADTQRQYWRLLTTSLAALVAGEELISREQILRARLWMWFYRSASDVNSSLIPHWHLDNQERFRSALTFALTQPESDADPLFPRVARWWKERTPALMRAERTDLVSGYRRSPVTISDPLHTTLDEPREEVAMGEVLTSATNDRRVRLLKGWAQGTAVIGRMNGDSAAIGLPMAALAGPAYLVLTFATDALTRTWLTERFGEDTTDDTGTRSLTISIGTQVRAHCALEHREDDKTIGTCHVPVDPDDVSDGGLVIVSLAPGQHSRVRHALAGVELQTIKLTDRGQPELPDETDAEPELVNDVSDEPRDAEMEQVMSVIPDVSDEVSDS